MRQFGWVGALGAIAVLATGITTWAAADGGLAPPCARGVLLGAQHADGTNAASQASGPPYPVA
ncbi:hypothetical protein D3C81_582050 [compost metagenome]|uniref:Uncharacterized protein n=1 Tax=Cupriavidus campinensis TaxID=151783 RepID=A0ABY3ESK3_9BURK|nr:hypothetical protein [Cupriavidus campinensis]TSP13880.1 hypothetical protein FGG12_05225 [Cupriavidus campinensis]CAG2134678.1 hypothetical protein LMG19282_00962 [Cupriavidus campinensis]